MKNYALLSLLVAAIFSSCTLTVNVDFQKDMSGKYNMKLDMAQIMAMGGDTTEADLGEDDLDQLKISLESTPGISGVSTSFDPAGYFEITYNFDGISSLNTALKSDSEGTNPGLMSLAMKGKKLTIDMTPGDELKNDDSGSMEGMGDMFTMNFNMKFDRPVKSVKSSIGVFNKEENTIAFSLTLSDLADSKKNWKTQVTFK
ncbi:MAG: hypothetical protein JNM00_13870 [Flavobacteriales bacterium]|nr:hypothetical protein [Flavobacteriales bacterium]